jgi:hypothetical protein
VGWPVCCGVPVEAGICGDATAPVQRSPYQIKKNEGSLI